MNKSHKRLMSLLLTLSMCCTGIPAFADASNAPDAANLSVKNNAGISDVVTITGLTERDFVRVYRTDTGGSSLGTATAVGSTTANVYVSQFGSAAGTAYVTITTPGKTESPRTPIAYDAEETSTALDPLAITVTNYAAPVPDTVTVTGLSSGDRINVYEDVAKTKKIGTGLVASGGNVAIANIGNLSDTPGNVHVCLVSRGYLESTPTPAPFLGEEQTDSSIEITAVIVNNASINDIITISNLVSGDVIKAYSADEGGTAIGSVTVASGKTSGVISIKQLSQEAGSVWLTLTKYGKKESDRIQVDYLKEPTTTAINAADVAITNNAGVSDVIVASDLAAGNIVKVYDNADATTPIGTGTVPAGKTTASITIKQLSVGAGTVYISLTTVGNGESLKTPVNYTAESESDALDAANVSITNNATLTDTVSVTNLTPGDQIRVYGVDTGGTPLGSASVAAGKTSVLISIKQIGNTAGNLYLSIIKAGQTESPRVAVPYLAEPNSDAPNAALIAVTNNPLIPDTVLVSGVSSGTVIKVYNAATEGSLLGNATVGTGKSEVLISIKQLGEGAGSVYVTLTLNGKVESSRVEATYLAEPKTGDINPDIITVENNATLADIVTVTNLTEGDTVLVYDSPTSTKALGNAKVGKDKSEVSISIKQLGEIEGSVYVSIINAGKSESSRLKVDYPAEPQTLILDEANVSVSNNAAAIDSVTVNNVLPGDIIKVYIAAAGGVRIGAATVAKDMDTISVPVSQLGTAAGTVFVTRTILGERESARLQVDYLAEPQSDAPAADKVLVINNPGTDLFVKYNLNPGDTIKIYTAQNGGRLIGTGTVAPKQTHVVITIPQLGKNGGSIFISITKSKQKESSRTEVLFDAE